MKRLLVSLTIFAVASVGVATAQSGAAHNESSIMGTWELVSAEYNGQAWFAGNREVKMISPKHFMWVLYDGKKMKTMGAGSGSYTLTGDSYVEHVDFIDINGRSGVAGQDYKFKIRVDGNTLTQDGDIQGMSLRETWKRID